MKKVHDQQLDTKNNEKENIEPHDQHIKAVYLRLEGQRYRQIAQLLGLQEQTVRRWFSRGGICASYYRSVRSKHYEERRVLFDKIHDQLEDMAIDAVATLRKALQKGNVTVAFKILELNGFMKESNEKNEVTNFESMLENILPKDMLPTL